MSRRLLWASVLIGAALSIAGDFAVASQKLVIGSRDGGWVYEYLQSFHPASFAPSLIATLLVTAAAIAAWPLLRRLTGEAPGGRTSVGECALVLALCVVAIALQGLLRSLTPFSLGAIFASDTSNSFYSVALKYDARTILGDFERLRSSWPRHAQSNLPGKLLLIRALIHISARADMLAWLTIAISNLGGVLLYFFVRDLFEDRFIAGLSLVLYLVTPAKLFFFPLLNTVTPVVVLACAWLLIRWLNGSKSLYAALLGAGVYFLILFEPTALIIGVLFAPLLMRAVRRGRMSLKTAVRHVLVGVVAFAAVHGVMAAGFGFNLLAALRHVAVDAVAFNVDSARPYGIWLRQNIVDFFFGIGVCQAVLFWAAIGDGIAGSNSRTMPPGPMALLCLATLATVAAADAIGVNRGEVIRLWIFLACLCQIPAAYVCARLNSRVAFALVLITTLLQDSLGSAMVAFIVPG